MRLHSRRFKIPSQILLSSVSIFPLYSFIIATWSSLPLLSSFCSMEDIILHEALLAPITFLYATERRFLSSTVNSSTSTVFATFSMNSTISSYRSACSANFAM
ncbi:hypothetical protein V8G54_018287 [Vigna mungo]|uniref:Uncharacterized protein n=1 Tax=Vigna mungo TaxID=3915 RepID=A0AAQ3N9T7_VIGMU